MMPTEVPNHNMLTFFKRLFGVQPPEPVRPVRRSSKRKKPGGHDVGGPASVPEVVEGNEHTDWDLWEDSVNALDSRMQSLTPTANIYQDTQPSAFDDIDPFARVGKNRDA
jgi:hypothetical protein